MKELEDIQEFRSSPDLRRKLYEYSIVKEYKAGDVLLSENSPIRSIPIVTRGAIRVIRTDEDGRELLLYYITAGESCIMSFLGGLHNDTSKIRAEVEEDAEILFLPVEQVRHFIQEYPQWLDYIFRLYHKRFEELLEVVNAVTFKKVDERLVLLLQKKAQLAGSPVVQTTHAQLATELATARVVVSRLLKQMEEEGLIRLGRNQLKLNRPLMPEGLG